MSAYLSYKFKDSVELGDTYDELPLWSAPFGMMLLKHIEYRPDLKILDIGSGTGFPLVEIAERFGDSCTCYGLDAWDNANKRARKKVKAYGLKNVTILNGSASNIPFEDNSLDLIVSNLGINNFDNAPHVFKECYRTLKHGGKLCITTNLQGHWEEFYTIFKKTLQQAGETDILKKLIAQEEQRGTPESTATFFTNANLKITKQHTDSFEMKYVDGSIFLNHHFVKLGWLNAWRALTDADNMASIFTTLEQALNTHAQHHCGLTLTVPMLYVEGEKH